MGQKVHPYGFRLGFNKPWRSRWFSKQGYAGLLQEDLELKEGLRKQLKSAGVSSIEVDRPGNKLRVTIRTSRPGIIIGRKGAEIEKLKTSLAKKTKREVFIDIQEVHKPELDAQLVSESIALQLEKRVAFRRAMRKAVDSALRFGCKGIKVRVSGRLNGAEIARSEWYLQGQLPLHTLRADIDYGTTEAHTTYGVIGVKAWLYKGDILEGGKRAPSQDGEPRRNERGPGGPRDRDRDRRPRRDGDRPGGEPGGESSDRPAVAAGAHPIGEPAAPVQAPPMESRPARTGGPIMPPLMAPLSGKESVGTGSEPRRVYKIGFNRKKETAEVRTESTEEIHQTQESNSLPASPLPSSLGPSVHKAERGNASNSRVDVSQRVSVSGSEQPSTVSAPPARPESLNDKAVASPANNPLFRCSAFFPERVERGEINRIIACVHLETAASQVVREAAKRLELRVGTLLKAVSQWPVVSLPLESKIDVTADVPGLLFDVSSGSMRLWEEKQFLEFRFKPTAGAVGQACHGWMHFWLQGMLLADVPIVVFVADGSIPEIFRATLAEANSKPYRRVFPSYSHNDAQVVTRLEVYSASFGDEYLRDISTLRAGQMWTEELQKLIRRADVFQLFWSENAASSAYVEEEWRNALREREIRPDPFFVRPVYWTEQPAPIPEELKQLHFVRTPL